MQESIDNNDEFMNNDAHSMEELIVMANMRIATLESLVNEARTLLRLSALLYIDSQHEDMQESIVEFIGKSQAYVPDQQPEW
jgi:hypothetical protein